jgi:hypothetical protein
MNGDPSKTIADIRNVAIVFKDGVAYDPDRLLDSVRGRYGRILAGHDELRFTRSSYVFRPFGSEVARGRCVPLILGNDLTAAPGPPRRLAS